MRTDSELRKEIGKHFWFHSIELRPGIVTQGNSGERNALPMLGLPEDLTGKTVLDIGAWDGFFSFECEKRGAKKVIAADLWENTGRGAFDLAREELNSSVEPLECSIYDLPEKLKDERFDLVLFLGVLYHLKHPLLALEKVARLTAPGGVVIVNTVIDVEHMFDAPSVLFFPGDELNGDATSWCAPNLTALSAMLGVVGFTPVISVVQLFGGDRTVFHAVKGSDEHVRQLAEREQKARKGLFGKAPQNRQAPVRRVGNGSRGSR